MESTMAADQHTTMDHDRLRAPYSKMETRDPGPGDTRRALPAESVVRLRTLIRTETASVPPRRVEKGKYIYHPGDHDENIYLIECGRVKVSIPT
jgi:CRP-like cAMP-binding protein